MEKHKPVELCPKHREKWNQSKHYFKTCIRLGVQYTYHDNTTTLVKQVLFINVQSRLRIWGGKTFLGIP